MEHVRKPIVVQLPRFGVSVLESYHAPGFASPLLCHAFSKFILVIAGQGRLQADGRIVVLCRDVLLHVPARTPHRLVDDAQEPVALYAACYDPDPLAAGLCEHLSRNGVAPWRLPDHGPHLVDAFRAQFREMLFEQHAKRPGWETALRSRLGDLLVRTVRMQNPEAQTTALAFEPGRPSAERVALYAARLETRFFFDNTLDDAARATGLSRRRFTELFRNVTGQSWRPYVQQLRLKHAQKLLWETDKPIVAVVFESGFDDVSHFHRVFKRVFGVAPRAFREQARTQKRPGFGGA